MTLKSTATIKTNEFIDYLVEKLPEMCLNLQACTSSSIEQKQHLVTNLLRDYLQTISQVHASSTEAVNKQNTAKSYSVFCSTSLEP